MEHESQQLANAMSKIQRASKVICIVIVALALLFVASFLVSSILALAISQGDDTQTNSIVGSIFARLPSTIIACCALYVGFRIFFDIWKGVSPFSRKNVKRLRILGWLLLISAILQMAIEPLAYFSVSAGDITAGFSANDGSSVSSEPVSIKIDARALIEAGICFGLSLIFKYGALLQVFSDETL